jgi:hypothetical protein
MSAPCLYGPKLPGEITIDLAGREPAGLVAAFGSQRWRAQPPVRVQRLRDGQHFQCKCVANFKGFRREDQSARGASALERWDALRADEGGRDSGQRRGPTSAPTHRLRSAASTSATTTGSFS